MPQRYERLFEGSCASDRCEKGQGVGDVDVDEVLVEQSEGGVGEGGWVRGVRSVGVKRSEDGVGEGG